MSSKKINVKSVFLSDLHLGTPGSKALALDGFLKNIKAENIFLVGDIIDGWQMAKNPYWPQSHTDVVRRILSKARKGANIYYAIGNHDEMLRKWLFFKLKFGNIEIKDRFEYKALDGKKYLILHGDYFDGIHSGFPFIAHVGDFAYHFMINFNKFFNKVRMRMGFEYWSLSKFLKQKVKKAVDALMKIEKSVVNYCKSNGFDGAILGHTHIPDMKEIDGIKYMNSGDWVEECTSLLEHHDGSWELYRYDNKHWFDQVKDEKS